MHREPAPSSFLVFGLHIGAGLAHRLDDFVERYAPGGLKLSINDGGARPDTVMLRLAQAVSVMEEQQ